MQLTAITLQTANTLFKERKFQKSFHQFSHLIVKLENPAFCSFMAGKCLESMGNLTDVYSHYQKALSFDDSNAFINLEIEHFQVSNNIINTNKKNILHYFPNTTNIGDSGAAAGIRKLLESQTDSLFFYTLSCRKDTITHIRQLPFKPSGIIIGGGGLFFKQPSSSGWYFPLSAQELESLSLPTITYAIGFNQEYSDNDAWQLDRTFQKHVAEFHKHLTLKSVRDIWSQHILEGEGVSDLYLVPCPSTFLEPLPWFNLNLSTHKKIIGLSITDRSLKNGMKSNVISSFFGFARWLLQHDFFPLFILHDSGDDLSLAKLLTDNHFSCILPNTAREAITIYDQCYGVVGMRGHSLILSAGRCVPFLGISYNKKIDAYMETLNLQEYCLDQNTITKDIVLVNAFEKLLLQKDTLVTHLKNTRDLFYTSNRTFCKKAVIEFLKK